MQEGAFKCKKNLGVLCGEYETIGVMVQEFYASYYSSIAQMLWL